MSKVITESARCDMTKQEATAEREFTLDGVTYHLDLSAKSAEKFDHELARYTAKASVVNVAPSVLREWARENGYEVGARGRIDASVADAFAKARLGAEAPIDAAAE